MASVNRVILIGNLGRDPEIRYTQAGEPIANFSLATTEKWTGKDGNKQERTEWHRVEVFGKTAQVVRDYCQKGKQVYIEGSPSTTTSGRTRTATSATPPRSASAGRSPGSCCWAAAATAAAAARRRRRRARRARAMRRPALLPADDFQVSDDDVPF